MLTLINQVLDFQKIETGAMDWHISHVNLRDIITDALTATQQLVQDKNIQIDRRLPERVPAIAGDRDRLIQVMVNLISNAVKFCEDGQGKILITVDVAQDQLKVDVKDNGIGISEADQKVIFEEFRQIKHTTRGRPHGSGLGLAIARRIIDFHGGNIWVDSKPGKGSTFSFTLPREIVHIEV